MNVFVQFDLLWSVVVDLFNDLITTGNNPLNLSLNHVRLLFGFVHLLARVNLRLRNLFLNLLLNGIAKFEFFQRTMQKVVTSIEILRQIFLVAHFVLMFTEFMINVLAMTMNILLYWNVVLIWRWFGSALHLLRQGYIVNIVTTFCAFFAASALQTWLSVHWTLHFILRKVR